MTDRFLVAGSVKEALHDGRPVVALETSVLSQGLPHPRNLEAAGEMAGAIRKRGVEPAWIFVDRGAVRVGATDDDLGRLASGGAAAKVARRDLPLAVAGGGLGATTVSATVWAAHRAGIEASATGGIGGVHVGSGDVSADLLEMARTPGVLVCAGPKSIVDPLATLERLEELGVAVIGYRCDWLPFFVVRQTGIELEHRANTAAEVAATAGARRQLSIDSTLLICNPIAEEHALSFDEVAAAVATCGESATRKGVRGKAVTPYLLSCLAERTGGRSLEANIALLVANARLAADIAGAIAVS